MGTKRILIADDERDILLVLEKRLESAGFLVTTVESGSEAIEVACNNPPDFVILDVLMPDMEGWEVARRLEEMPQTSGIPIIYVTGMFPKRQNDEVGRDVAGYKMFSKPFNFEAILAEIHHQIRNRELQISSCE